MTCVFLISYVKHHSFNYKTNKSIYNILSGKKSHQTFFDASSQQLLSLYHSLPKLKYQTFERLLNKNDIKELNIKVHPRFTYDSLNNTFKCIQLLIQTISQYLHHQLKFVPMNQQVIIQNKVKKIYGTIIKNDLIKALKKTITEFYGENIEKSPDFGRIVNQKHFNRLNDLIQIHKDNVVFGGNSSKEDLYIEPTLLDNITNDNKIMKEEIFGPILPIITYDNFDEVLEIIQSKSKPLSLYLFSEDENMTHRVVEELSFGGGAINDTLMHLANPNLPFGGVGSSGIGQYHGKYSFDTFSHMKSYTFKSTRLESSLFFPPYKGKFKYIKTFFKN